MKPFLFSILLTFIFQTHIDGQPNLIERIGEIYIPDSTKWRNTLRETYQYDEQGRLIEELKELWFSLRWDWGNSERTSYFYDEDDYLFKKIHNKYQVGTDNYQNLYTDTYEYDQNGCLLKEANELISIHGDYPQYYFDYTVNENCQTQKRVRRKQNVNNTNTFQENIYTYDAHNRLISDSTFIEYQGEMTFYLELILGYDELDRVIEKSYLRGPSFSPIDEYEVWKYDEQGNNIYYEKWRDSSFSPHQIIKKDSFDIEYDEQNRMVKRKIFHWDFQNQNPTVHEKFNYYCDDILRTSDEEKLPHIYRYQYKYDSGFEDDCLRALEDASIKVFPNPTFEFLNIHSDLLGGKNTKIFIYDVLGRQHYSTSFQALSSTKTINLQTINLSQGIYFLMIENGEKVATAKFFFNQ